MKKKWGEHHFLPFSVLGKKLPWEQLYFNRFQLPSILWPWDSRALVPFTAEMSCSHVPLTAKEFQVSQGQSIPQTATQLQQQESLSQHLRTAHWKAALADCTQQPHGAALGTQSSLQLPGWLLGWYQPPNLNSCLKTCGKDWTLTAWRSHRTVTAFSRIFLYRGILWTGHFL